MNPSPSAARARSTSHRPNVATPRRHRARSAVPSLTLTQPRQVIEAAALLFNTFRKQWGPSPTGAQMRTLAAMLAHSQLLIEEQNLDRRLDALEEEVRARKAALRGAPAGLYP